MHAAQLQDHERVPQNTLCISAGFAAQYPSLNHCSVLQVYISLSAKPLRINMSHRVTFTGMLSTCSTSEETLSFPFLIILALAICACCFLMAIFVVRVKEVCFDVEPESDNDIEALRPYDDDPSAHWVRPYNDTGEKEVLVVYEKV